MSGMKSSTIAFAIALSSATMFAGASANAAESVENRQISAIGCHAPEGDGTCYVRLTGAAFGASQGCSHGDEFRFDHGHTPMGQLAYISMLSAKMKQRPVSVYLAGCTRQGMPSLSWYYVH
jgi:hypothetical protein